MKKIHIAIGVADIGAAVKDYSARLGCRPTLVVMNEYALWRTDTVNFSIRHAPDAAGTLRHLGWEDSTVTEFTQEKDVNGIVWELFNAGLQADEIRETWPQVSYTPED
ncbi:MAG TPA: hypothetical protein VGL10_02520 [Gammaproteobacteria bacterium]